MILKFLITTVAILLAANLVPGVSIQSPMTALVASIVLCLLNQFVKPILIILTIPFTVITFGLFLLIINTFLLLMTAHFVKGLIIDSDWIAFKCSVFISCFILIVDLLIGSD